LGFFHCNYFEYKLFFKPYRWSSEKEGNGSNFSLDNFKDILSLIKIVYLFALKKNKYFHYYGNMIKIKLFPICKFVVFF